MVSLVHLKLLRVIHLVFRVDIICKSLSILIHVHLFDKVRVILVIECGGTIGSSIFQHSSYIDRLHSLIETLSLQEITNTVHLLLLLHGS